MDQVGKYNGEIIWLCYNTEAKAVSGNTEENDVLVLGECASSMRWY